MQTLPYKVRSYCKPHRVFIALNLSENAGRRILAGILRFVNSGRRWQLNIANEASGIIPGFTQQMPITAFDGVIGGLPELSNVLAKLLGEPIPFVLNVTPEHIPIPLKKIQNTVFVDVDNAAIGHMAFDYLATRGNFLAIAFVSDRADRRWSVERETAFIKGWARKGIKVRTLKFNSNDRPYDVSVLDDFLLSLPKPAAIWCVYDNTAVTVLESCIRCKIKVPDQLAILSTDNDETLCRYASPTLSSIELPQEQLGYLAAQELELLMSGRKTSYKTILTDNHALKIVERDSTRRIPPAMHLITEAMGFISAHACDRISVSDIVAHLGVSRSLLDLRFRQVLNKSIGQTIQDEKIKEIKRRLKHTDAPMSQIATSCSFSSLPRLAHFFKHMTGMSMREFRKRNGT